tara:strand:- start:42 stop:4763 length:4722 start_codon:yes stop_codon:yes gene_type:complete
MASPYADLLKTLPGASVSTVAKNLNNDDDPENDVGTFQSIMAGIGSGLFKIPEGLFSLGATLIDLGADTNKAAEVENFFAKINPFDEMADATTAGKITELITNIAIPGGAAFKLANTAVKASKGGNYLNMAGTAGKNINNGIKKTLNQKNKIKAFDESASKLEKAGAFATAAGAGGVAEGIFVGDVEDAGTFGDLIGGPTKLERQLEGEEYDPAKEILNRIKFGTEGALFTGALGGAGAVIKKLRNTTNAGKAADRSFLEYIAKNLRPRGELTEATFPITKTIEGAAAGDINAAETAVQELDGLISGLFPYFKRLKGDKVVDTERKKILAKMNRLITSGEVNPKKKLGETTLEFDLRTTAPKYKKGDSLKAFQLKVDEFENIKPDIQTNYLKTLTFKGAQTFEKKISKLKKKEIKQLVKKGLPEKEAGKIINDKYVKNFDKLKSEFIKDLYNSKDLKKLNLLEEELTNVNLGPMNKKLVKEFEDDILKLQPKGILKGKKTKDVLKKDISEMLENMGLMRIKFGSLFNIIGKRLDTDGVRNFKNLFEKKVSTWLDRSYDIFKGRNSQLLDNYTVSAQAMAKGKVGLQKLYQLANGGKEVTLKNGETIVEGGEKLSSADLEQTIKSIVGKENIKFDRGFRLADKGDPAFKVPDFFVGNSTADEALKLNNPVRLSELTGIQKQVMEDIMGKNKDALQTIIEATQSLSSFARGNQLKDELLKTDQALKAAGRTGIFANNPQEAIKQFSKPGQTLTQGVDYGQVGQGVKRTPAGLQGAETMRGPRIDPLQTLRPIGDEAQPYFQGKPFAIIDPIAEKYTLQGNIDGIFKPLNEMANSKSLRSSLYSNLILYPKATSQMAKTILSPFTHARNFISAGAFAAANGMIPFADREAVRRAFNALQTPLIGTRKNIKAGTNIKKLAKETDKEFKIRKENYLEGNEFYQKLLKLGVVNSQVQLGDLRNLLGDVKFGGLTQKVAGGLDNFGLNRLLKVLGKAKKYSEDFYTAEDDFWKIFSFIGEGNRLRSSYRSAGLSGAQQFHDLAGARRIKDLIDEGMPRKEAEELVPKVRFDEDFLDNEAASIVKNNIPNYAYVGNAVKGLRKMPVGNFVSFPAEIIRTGVNIVERALDEIFYTTTINGKLVSPLKGVGVRRLTGMAFTSTAVPAGVVAGASAIYDVTDDERAALKNYVASWSKNSTLVPIRDMKTGKLKVIDFSHSNAYDTLSRPIQTILNKIAAGEGDRDGMLDDFYAGMIEATKELAMPFVTESIWTEALSDIYMRGGETREGFDVWESQDKLGTKFKKGIYHLMMSQAPLNWKQLERLNLSVKPIDDLGRLDDRGRQYEFGNEALGVIGFRAQEIDPNKAIKYKIAVYNRDARESKSLFTQEVLKGGVTTPKQIIDAYLNANRALFETEKILYKDIKDAKILNANESELAQSLIKGVGKKSYGKISNGIFTPVNISKNVIRGFQQIAEDIQEIDPNFENPLYDSFGAIANIRGQLFNVGLEEDEFLPEIDNPFDTPPLPSIIQDAVGQLPSFVTSSSSTPNIIGGSQISLPSEQYTSLYPNDDLAAAYLDKKKLGQR